MPERALPSRGAGVCTRRRLCAAGCTACMCSAATILLVPPARAPRASTGAAHAPPARRGRRVTGPARIVVPPAAADAGGGAAGPARSPPALSPADRATRVAAAPAPCGGRRCAGRAAESPARSGSEPLLPPGGLRQAGPEQQLAPLPRLQPADSEAPTFPSQRPERPQKLARVTGAPLQQRAAGCGQRHSREQRASGNSTALLPEAGLRKDTISFVLCTTAGDKEGFLRVPTLLASLVRFVEPASAEVLVLVVPRRDRDAVSSMMASSLRALRPAPFSLRFVHDEDILSSAQSVYAALLPEGERTAKGGRGASYRTQMLLKLGVAQFINTSFYVTLDADVFLKRPLSLSDVVPGGKGLVQGREGSRHRLSWWKAAGQIVHDTERCGRRLGWMQTQIGVTPAVLSTSLARAILGEVERLYPAANGTCLRWDTAMFHLLADPDRRDWTEYTLYWAFACKLGVMKRLHTRHSSRRLYDATGFDWNTFDQYNVSAVFADNSTLFGVVQSIIGASSAEVIALLTPRLLPAHPPGHADRGNATAVRSVTR
eukprot:TRINITY_DN16590_c0_g1_i1.p1 TRINITY_DN16590_c0_g1~~TRINITY_DN16590_c0_g1_i1.p1  ORF type:complete len:572 (+),score=74.56 TRINITY_DN16590_c0_g1_i1:87-1718(+)